MSKILIIEDDSFTNYFYKHFFSKTKYQIVFSEDGNEIFENLGTGNIGLIMMDINLTNTFLDGVQTDGVVLSKKIKEHPEFKNVPILLVTAYAKGYGPKNYFEESLADDYIVKPISDFNELLNKIEKLINE